MVNSILQEDDRTIIHIEGDNSRGVMRRALQVRYGCEDIDNTVIVVCDEAGNLMDFKLSPHDKALLIQALDVHNAAPETGRKCGASEDIDILNEVSLRLGDIIVEYKRTGVTQSSPKNDREYRVESISGSSEWFTAEELINWQKRMNTAIRLVLEKTGE